MHLVRCRPPGSRAAIGVQPPVAKKTVVTAIITAAGETPSQVGMSPPGCAVPDDPPRLADSGPAVQHQRMRGSVLSALAVCLLAGPTAPARAEQLAPTSRWTVEYADNLCALTRRFGEADRAMILGFKPAPMSDDFRVVVIESRKSAPLTHGVAEVRAGSGSPAIKAPFMSWSIKKADPMRMTAIDLKRSDLASLGNSGDLSIRAAKMVDTTFAVSNFSAALRALDACVVDLLKTWGMDAAQQEAVASYPKSNFASYFSDGDYPADAIRLGQQGTVGFRVFVSTDGKPMDCAIYESSGSAPLDNQTCHIMRTRAKFEPARDKTGKALAAPVVGRIRWQLSE